jgi:hypothetical protein
MMVRAGRVVRYEALNPCGYMPDVRLISLTPRHHDLNDKVVYITYSWSTGSGSQLDELGGAMAQFTFPSGMVVLVAPPRVKEWAKKGYSKKDFKDYIWSHATLPMKIFR